MRLKVILLLSVVAWSGSSISQSGLSLYHLNNKIFQGNNFNAAFFPEGKVFLGLPVISGVMIDVNTPVNYDRAVTTNAEGNKEWDISRFINDAKSRNYISAEAELSTLYIGIRKSKTVGFSFFIRERMGARGFYSNDLVQLTWNGNKQFIGDNIDLSKTAIDIRYYREYGIGIWKSIPNKALNIGVRVKFLNGMMSLVTDNKFDGSIGFVNNSMNFDFSNANVYSSGLNIDGNDLSSHLISNNNLGVGIDLGAYWKINEKLSVALSINDLGFIRWNVDTENFTLKDTVANFVGIENLGDIDDLGDVWVESLKNIFEDTTFEQSYTTGLNTTAYGSLMYQLSPDDMVTGTISSHIVKGHFRMLYGIGYTRKVGKALDFSANVTRIPQQGIDLGLAASVNVGVIQMYLASDKLLRIWDMNKVKAVDLRFGINFVFGRPKNSSNKEDRSDLLHKSPYDKKERVEKSDGIYWIVKKKKPRPIYRKTHFEDK